MEEELSAMVDHGVWEVVSLPGGKRAVGVKWVFKVKVLEDGTWKFKARLVAKGFSQVIGEDYGHTFSRTGKASTSRVLLSLAACRNWFVHQMDVCNAFLNGELAEEVFMHQPPGFEDGTGRVCRLLRSLYGLKQSPRCWNKECGSFLQSIGFSKSGSDEALYIRHDSQVLCVVLVYVDDLLLCSAELSQVQDVKRSLCQRYKMKDLGEVSLYLSMQVRRNMKEGWLEMGQQRYAKRLEGKFASVLERVRGSSTPMPKSIHPFLKSEAHHERGELVDSKLYQSLIGSLLCAATSTRPDIAFAVNTLSQHLCEPYTIHMLAATHVLRYLVDTNDQVLRYERGAGPKLVGYTDSTWAGEGEGKSRGAFVFCLGGGAVAWRSKKQECVALSSTEAEYMALTDGAQEATWLGRLLKELGEEVEPVLIRVDNQSAIALAHNPVLHGRTKHINVQWHFVREAVEQGKVIQHVQSRWQDADFLTKPLGVQEHANACFRLGVVKGSWR
jgi:hypothetical protein